MFLIISLCLLAYTVASSSAAPSAPPKPCKNIPNGYCIDLSVDSCPSDTYISYSGCDFMEECCYKVSNDTQTTSSPSGLTCGVTDYTGDYKIVGGTQTVIEKHPWQVIILTDVYDIIKGSGTLQCGGSILNENWILCAAHCFNDPDYDIYTDNIYVGAGYTNQALYSHYNMYTVERVISHPQFVMNVKNDIALVKLNSPLDLSGSTMKPICLPDKGDDFTGQTCTATGWGVLDYDDTDIPDILSEVELPIVDHLTCNFYDEDVTANFICAGPRTGGKDTCQGDSGGPLVCKGSNGAWKQAGIVSYGPGCATANKFGVYTEVSKYIDWIETTMSQN